MKILTNPNPLLRQKASKVVNFDDQLREKAAELIKMMLDHDGVGLAATQVGWPQRLIALNIEEKYEYPDNLPRLMVLANPQLFKASLEQVVMDEACLSVPGYVGPVLRPKEVTVIVQDLWGNTLHIDANTWFARVLQHEIDHLNGILFIDRISDKSLIKKYELKKGKEKSPNSKVPSRKSIKSVKSKKIGK